MNTPATPRPASTVVVLRPRADAFEVLLVRRNDRVAFMAGAFVFPGGRVDAADRAPSPAPALLEEPPRFSDLSAEDELAYRRAAVRELQEEAAVSVEVGALIPIGHWVTPEIDIRRYDTRFFLTVLPPGQEARHDEGETTEIAWCTPADALARGRRGEIMLPPPTWTTLRQLERHADDGRGARLGTNHAACPDPAQLSSAKDRRACSRCPAIRRFPHRRLGGARGDAVRARGGSRMAASPPLNARLDELIALFNRRSLDLPDGLFDRRTQFLLNGKPFEAHAGPLGRRSAGPDDRPRSGRLPLCDEGAAARGPGRARWSAARSRR